MRVKIKRGALLVNVDNPLEYIHILQDTYAILVEYLEDNIAEVIYQGKNYTVDLIYVERI
jgi:hypothetical protein